MLHLPAIVDAAESSPKAAAAAAYQIRKFLSRDHLIAAHRQYNAIMLIKILADNPGPSFTKNMNEKFVEAVKSVLRQSRDPSVQQIMRETLQSFDTANKKDTNLQSLLGMWHKERSSPMPFMRPSAQSNAHPGVYQQPAQGAVNGQPHSNGRLMHQLPEPAELAGRIEEARNSSKLLISLVSTTPPEEFDNNDLIAEFADRCLSAQRSLQGYMNCTDPPPDEQTLQHLVESCEQLSLASSRHQRAKLAATRHRNSSLQAQARSQEPSPNPSAVASPRPLPQSPPQEATPTPSMTGAVNVTRRFSSRNPFSDENRLLQRKSVGSGEGPRRYYATPSVERSPPPGTVELEGNDTPITTQPSGGGSVRSSLSNSYSSQNPAPNWQSQHLPTKSPTIVDDEDVYSSSPTTEANPNLINPYPPPLNTPKKAASDPYEDLYSLDPPSTQQSNYRKPATYPSLQQTATNGTATHPAATFQSPSRGQGEASAERVKDDVPTPMPVVSVSGSGWRY